MNAKTPRRGEEREEEEIPNRTFPSLPSGLGASASRRSFFLPSHMTKAGWVYSPTVRRRQPRRGFAAVLAMLYLMLFTVLAIGFSAATAISLQIANNDQAAHQAQAAAESGMQFVKYQLGRIEIPQASGSASDDLDLTTIARLISVPLDGSANMNGHPVAAIDNAIYLPAADDFVILDTTSHARFQAQITSHGRSLSVKVIGYGQNPSIGRAIRLEFGRKISPNAGIKFVAAPGTYEEVSP
jgi:Tfp pilus assembly protein PilX